MRYINPKAIPAPNMPGWYLHPDFPKYAISEDGQIWSYHRKRLLKPTIGRDGYLKTGFSNNGQSFYFRVHRLVGWVFVKLPEEFNGNYDIATINHKDHVRTNNHYMNLAWITLCDNSREPWSNGYMEHLKKPGFCIPLKDKKFLSFDSISSIDRYTNSPIGATGFAITNNKGILQGKYIVGYMEDLNLGILQSQGVDGIIQTYSDAIANYTPNKKECFYIDSLDNTCHEFDSARDIDRDLDLPIDTTGSAIRKNNGLIQGRYIAGYLNDPEWKEAFANSTIAQIVESYADQIKNYKPVNRGPKKITDLQTGESKIYNSLADFAREKGMHPNSASNYLRDHSDLYRVELA